MPLPIGHGILGASILLAAREPRERKPLWQALLLGAGLGNLPDVDLALAWLLGGGALMHGGWTHSFVFAALVGLLVAGWQRRWHLWRPQDVLLYGGATLSHGFLDMLVRKEFGGAALYWPLSDEKLRFGLFDYFAFYPGSVPLEETLWRALQISFYEALIFAPLLLLAWWWQTRRERQVASGRLPRSARWPVRVD